MNAPHSSRDLEQISAYLDEALSPRELSQFKERLNAEPELASALQEMQRTRAMLRRAAQRRVPRSFAVTQQMVGARTSLFSGWTSLNFASAAATLLLAFVLIGDFSVNGLPIAGGAAAPEAPQALMAEAATDEAVGATPEIELFAQADRQTKGAETALGWSALFAQYAGELELALGAVAVISGLLAWRQKRHN